MPLTDLALPKSLTLLERLKPFFGLITYGAKLVSADWLRQMAFFLNYEGTFGNQEGIT